MNKGPDALGKFLSILRKHLSSFLWYKCAQWIFFALNFVKRYQTSQAPLSCFGAGQNFVRCEHRTDFTICTAWFKEKKAFKCAHDYQIENLAETNFVESFGRAKQILSVQCVQTLNNSIIGKLVLGFREISMGETDRYLLLLIDCCVEHISVFWFRKRTPVNCNQWRSWSCFDTHTS